MITQVIEGTIWLIIVVSLIMPIIINSKDIAENKDGKITFEFSKAFKTLMLICLIISATVTIILTIMNINDKSIIIGATLLSILTLLCLIVYLSAKNKKVIYLNNIFYCYNLLGKKKSYSITDITQAIEKPMDGIKLKFKDNKTVKIDIQMSNFNKLKELLDKNNIVCTDKNNKQIPKGW